MARLIAVELGAYAVKLSSFLTGPKQEFEGAWVQRVPQDGTGIPSLADRLASLDLLLRAHPELTADARTCELAWSSSRASVLRLHLPFEDAAQIEKTLPFAIESEVPFDLEDRLVSWRPSGAAGEVFAALALEDELSEVIDGMESRTIEPRAVRCDAEMLSQLAREPGLVTAIVDIGHDHTSLCVVRDGQPVWFRSIDAAGRSMTRAIQSALGCSWGEAEALKHGGEEKADDEETLTDSVAPLDADATDPAFGATLPAKAREALNGAISQVLAEIRAALGVAEDELDLGIDEVVLCGGGSRLPEIRVWMEQDLGVPVREPLDADGLPVRAEHAVVVATVWRMARDADGRALDLRVGELAFVGSADVTRAVLTYGGAALGFFLAAVVLMFAFQLRTLSNEQATVDGRLRDLLTATDPELAELALTMESTTMVSTMAGLVADAQEQADFLGDGNDLPATVDLLYRLTQAFPPHPTVTVNVNKLTINPGSIRIEGLTDGFTQVEAIVNSLRARGQFENVTHTTGKVDVRDRLDFVVNIDRTVEAEADPEVSTEAAPPEEEG
jgi:Tfp pilus assembly protein PilN